MTVPLTPAPRDVLSKLRHYLGLLEQITPAEAEHRRTGDLHLTVAELRVLVEMLEAAPAGAAGAPREPTEANDEAFYAAMAAADDRLRADATEQRLRNCKDVLGALLRDMQA